MRAYMSDPTDSEELRFCLRQGKDAGAELSKILAETEPERPSPAWQHPERIGSGHSTVHESRYGSMFASERAALRDSLAALVSDGGPLDQLAWDDERAYLASLSAFGTPGHPVTCQRRCCAPMANAVLAGMEAR